MTFPVTLGGSLRIQIKTQKKFKVFHRARTYISPSVTAIAVDGSGSFTSLREFTKAPLNTALPLHVSCPPVAEPGVEFACSFAAVGGGDATVEYAEGGDYAASTLVTVKVPGKLIGA